MESTQNRRNSRHKKTKTVTILLSPHHMNILPEVCDLPGKNKRKAAHACRSMNEKFQCSKSSGRRSLNSIVPYFALLSNVIIYREKQKVYLTSRAPLLGLAKFSFNLLLFKQLASLVNKCIIRRTGRWHRAYFFIFLFFYFFFLHLLFPECFIKFEIPGGGRCSSKFYTGTGSAPRSIPPLFVYHFWQKRYTFCIPSSDRWYPFHLPALEHYIPFKCFKSSVFSCLFHVHKINASVSPFWTS